MANEGCFHSDLLSDQQRAYAVKVIKDPGDARDAAAEERDRVAETLDLQANEHSVEAAGLDASQADVDEEERARHPEAREGAAELRGHSADDRVAAAQDRREAKDYLTSPVVGASTRLRARELAANERDLDAGARDADAAQRDLSSDEKDAAYEQVAELDRARHPADRSESDDRREASAKDRKLAALDRQAAALDRQMSEAELERWAVWEPERRNAETALRERVEWENNIKGAVTGGHLLVYSQPIIALATGEMVGEELLVRMQSGSGPGEVVLPADFLPQAEHFGLTPLIDRFMVSRAVELAGSGRLVSVNLSALSLGSKVIADGIIALIEASPAAAAPNLTFEITETAALADPAIARSFSHRLAELGAGLALDDFGTGFGSFIELRDLTLQVLKIDMSFVTDLVSSPGDQHIVKSVIAIAKEFGLTTIAEGVETLEVQHLLRGYGADQAQGFLYAAPALLTMELPRLREA